MSLYAIYEGVCRHAVSSGGSQLQAHVYHGASKHQLRALGVAPLLPVSLGAWATSSCQSHR